MKLFALWGKLQLARGFSPALLLLITSLAAAQNWLTYPGNYNGQRYSELDHINASNMKERS